ncbi:SDR family NAD(P)-dependent oxidoreductase [Novosphingobium sp. 9U]|uniref:SDR family NAD(P)-dependent oxidoreductase n=1 Tax=Novosphingobium sp. 9U TaxID=2653158 RepID=UPI0012F01C8A|nr:SDR family oxidoreductase [Novosphingobium sp. 9U]VWX50122.1 Short-chain dehydrogenase [Novosphingobium sp. 9U]
MSRRFEGKAAIVVGASAEGGSGWATAERLAAEGARVVVAARNATELARLAERIGGHAVPCDAADPAQIAHLVARSVELLGPIDIGIYAAGWPLAGTMEAIAPEQLIQAMGVNYIGPFCFVRDVAANMSLGGAISVISSIASTHVVPEQIAYACAKAATNTMIRYAALEFGAKQIRVNGVVPALIESPMTEPFRAAPGVLEAILKEVPLKRGATADDIAAACLWLASPECFVTGALLPVDGGNHLRRSAFPEDFAAGAFATMNT